MPTATARLTKSMLYRIILETLDVEKFTDMSPEAAREQAFVQVRQALQHSSSNLSQTDHERVLRGIVNELLALGPLRSLMRDGAISDILVNAWDDVYVERWGRLQKVDHCFDDNDHLLRTITSVVAGVGRRVDESSPMVDARLLDGSRVHAVIPPLAVDGPCLSIRRFGHVPLNAEDLVKRHSLSQKMLELLRLMVRGRVNIMISGGTGTGKTTLLNVLSASIPDSERIVTIEDAAELQLQQPHVVRLETRAADQKGEGAVHERELVIGALRMRPDRIIMGEVRGEEAFDMLQAMNTGHDGSLVTLHANSPREALLRLESMVAMAGARTPERYIRQHIASAIELIVQLKRFSDGTRKIVNIAEITGMEGETISMQDLFVFERMAGKAETETDGKFHATGLRPILADKLQKAGLPLKDSIFRD